MKLTNRDKFLLKKVKDTEKFLKINRNIIVLNADKGNTTVAMNKCDYDKRIKNIVEDDLTYMKLDKNPTNRFQKMNNNFVEQLFKDNIITTIEKNKLKTNIATTPKLYGVPKIHKKDFPLRPICSFINSPSYELSKYITRILKNLTENSEYNVKNSLQFKEKMNNIKINDNEKLVSLDVESLFPNVPIDLALIIINGKWDIIRKYTDIGKDLFFRILKFCIVDNRYFQLNGDIYTQQKGLPMGSPASPVVADIVMEELLDNCIRQLTFKPKILTKYVDDLFCIVSECEIQKLLTTFNSFHPNMKFTIERECDSKLPYLDTLIIRKGNTLLIDWYQKPTSSGRIINYFSKHPRRVIINTAKNLIERVLTISDKEFHNKNTDKIIRILEDNSFPNPLIHNLIRQYQYRKRHNINSLTEPKIYKPITYVPIISERLERSNIYDNKTYKIAHRSYNTLGKLFTKTKDSIHKLDKSNVVYKIPCKGNDNGQCNKVYVGTTKNKLKTRIAGHKSNQKCKHNITSQKTALTTHCVNLNHSPDFDNVTILNTENNYKRRYMLEMLQIIKVPTSLRINFKTDTDNVAYSYRHLVHKNKKGN